MNRTVLKEQARKLIEKNYWNSCAAGTVMALGSGILFTDIAALMIDPVSSDVFSFTLGGMSVFLTVVFYLLKGPCEYGSCRYFLKRTRDGKASLSDIRSGFQKDRFWKLIYPALYREIVIMLYALLFIIPGMIRYYDSYFTRFVIVDDPDLSPSQLHARSRELAKGHRKEMFLLDLSFILWNFASILTYSLTGVFYSYAYRTQTKALLYERLRRELREKQTEERAS